MECITWQMLFTTRRKSTCHLWETSAHQGIFSYWGMWRAGFFYLCGAWNMSQHLYSEPFKRLIERDFFKAGLTACVWDSRKTFVCVSKGSLPGVIRMIVGGVGLITVEKWSGQTSGGCMTCSSPDVWSFFTAFSLQCLQMFPAVCI